MSIVTLIILLVAIGVGLYFIQKAPIIAWMKTLITVVLVIIAILIILKAFGVWDKVKSEQVPTVQTITHVIT
jgi:membrane protein YdbS with pleckstrin-like domain